jgi:uncharacterized protein (DUF58 family)
LKIIRFFKNLYLTDRFFWAAGTVLVLFICAFFIRVATESFSFFDLSFLATSFFALTKTLVLVLLALVFADLLMLYLPTLKVECRRLLPKMMSLSDVNTVKIQLLNKYFLPLKINIIDELPDQFQKRDFNIESELKSGERKTLTYEVKPFVRGEYKFHHLNLFVRCLLGLAERRIVYEISETVPVYPSVLQMKQFELKAFTKISTFQGIKKLRKIGHSYEFEQIRNYVKGDDYRSINWKATSRHNILMVNQYEDERSQQVYCIIDKSRSMRMPFEGMSLTDYAVNSSLVVSNIVLRKYDKAGLLTFSDKIGSALKADNSPQQLQIILEALYREKDHTLEANYELLYAATKRFIRQRSLLLLFTNFESYYAMQRVLPLLRRINQQHLLVVIFFENTEVADFTTRSAKNVEEIYTETIARQFIAEKTKIVQELRQYGIQTILTRPADLSVNTINKYLELKAKGLI